MTTGEEKIQRLKELEIIEDRLKMERNFKALVAVYDELLKLLNSVGNLAEVIIQKAYCYARIGLKGEAEKTLVGLKNYSSFLDDDELYRSITLISFFLTPNGSKLNLMQINTIKSWLQDPVASQQVLQVIFDYKDFVGDIMPFDSSRLESRQTFFSKDLIQCVFSAMQSNNDNKIYYNKEKNDVQQEVEGYLSSHMAEDLTSENRKLANRIMNSESRDPMIQS